MTGGGMARIRNQKHNKQPPKQDIENCKKRILDITPVCCFEFQFQPKASFYSARCIHATSSNIVTMSPHWQGYFLNTLPMTESPDGWLTAWRQKQSVLKWPRLRLLARPRTGDWSGGGRPRGGKTTAPAAGRGSGGPEGGGFIKLAAGPAGWLTNTNPGLVLCFYIHLSLSAWSRNVQQPTPAATTLAVVSWIDR